MLTTLPWHLKATILGFDTMTYLVNAKRRESDAESPESGMLGKSASEVLMYRSMLRVCMLYLIMTFVILAPSVLVSVKNRENTNTAVSGVVSLMGFISYLIIAATENAVSVEHVCYSLQFCLCYASYCLWQEASGNLLLFACSDIVKYVSAVSTYAFPVILSHALVNGMHLSPYIIPSSFAGEIAGACSRATTLALDAFVQFFS